MLLHEGRSRKLLALCWRCGGEIQPSERAQATHKGFSHSRLRRCVDILRAQANEPTKQELEVAEALEGWARGIRDKRRTDDHELLDEAATLLRRNAANAGATATRVREETSNTNAPQT
jgi:hypothetical protein